MAHLPALAAMGAGSTAGIAAGTPEAFAADAAGAALGAVGATPGIVPTLSAALAAGAARSSTLDPPLGWVVAPRSLDTNANAKVHAKNTAAQAAVERDRKFALPLAPNKLPDAPLPKEAPMSAPLPC